MPGRILSTSLGANQKAFTTFDWLLFGSVSFIWGSSFLLLAIGLDTFDPGLVTWLRVGSGAAVLLAMPAGRTPIEPMDRPRIWALSIIWVAIPFTLFPVAQQWINSAVAGMLNGAVPIFAALVAALLLRKAPRGTLLAGLLVGFAGVVAISLPSISEGETQALGVVLVLLATVGYGIAVTISAPIQQKYGSVPVMARMLALATLFTTPYGIIGLTRSTFAWDSLLAVLATGVVNTALALVIMGTLVGRVGSTRASFITYLIPVVALVLGVVFRSDAVAWIAIIGVSLVITGALLASRRNS